MHQELRNILDVLRKYVEDNLLIIRGNEKEIRSILENEMVSDSRSVKLEDRFNVNKKLLEENNDTINLQVSIIKYLEKYKKTPQVSVKVVNPGIEPKESSKHIHLDHLSMEDVFELTINGQLEFNPQHPYYKNDEFYNLLMDYYIQIEDYEMCAHIQKKETI